MPELPEVECVRRTLAPNLAGADVVSVSLFRRDIVIGGQPGDDDGDLKKQLLEGDQLVALQRHGKNLFFQGKSGLVLCIQLGMTGRLMLLGQGEPVPTDPHIHCMWQLVSRDGRWTLCFRDPRRFGGLRPLNSLQAMQERIQSHLGPDALTLCDEDLAIALRKTSRSVKAALLDQTVLAGVGNIYADEALFTARIHPLTPAKQLRNRRVVRLAASIRATLKAALASGGSTISSYRNPLDESGQFQHRHLVYGRAGEPCEQCGCKLKKITVTQRTTVFCSRCQRWSQKHYV